MPGHAEIFIVSSIVENGRNIGAHGDVEFRDNRSAMHRACPFDEEASRRLMYRTTIKGDRIYLQA